MRRVTLRTTVYSAILIALLSLFLIIDSPVTAQTGGKDFGAETVEDDKLLSSLVVPVELVEEQSTDEVAHDAPRAGENEVPSSAARATVNEAETIDEETTTVLNAKDLDIAVLVKAMTKLTGRKYIVDSSVRGQVNIHLPSPARITIGEAIKIFDAVLLLKGFTTVPMGANIWKVIPAKDAQKTTIPLLLEPLDEPTDRLVTELIRLKYTRSEDLEKLLGQFISPGGLINSISGTNGLILIDSAANIERLKKLIEQVDVPATDQDITIIPILYAEAPDIAEKVKEILGEKEDGSTSSASPRITRPTPTRNPQTGATLTPASAVGARALPLKIIPDERTNSVIVVADPELTARVRAIIEQLDSPTDLSGGRFYVYQLKHADAEILADILSSVIGGASSTGDQSRKATTGSTLSRSSRETSDRRSPSTTFSERLSSVMRARNALESRTTAGGEGGATGKVNFEGEVSIAADPSTNTLIINASRADYFKVKELIDALDVKRRQVLVEATILEVTLSKDEEFGAELLTSGGTDEGGIVAQSNFGGLSQLVANPGALEDLTIAAASTGTITLPGGLVIPSQAILLNAVKRNSNVNVLSAPNIVTTDNEEAEIIVGENVPFVSSTSTDPSNLANTFNQVERQDVGITLRITPQISSGDFVTLRIFVEISNVVPTTRNDPNGPTTTIRTTETTVEVKNRQMIVTGGLISDSVTDSERGVPYLKDIPVLGYLFRRIGTNQRRTNLLIFITPRVLSNQFDARETTYEFRDSLANEMENAQVEPDRREVLESPNLDSVAEELPRGEKLPTPVTVTATRSGDDSSPTVVDELPTDAERRAIDRTKARLDSLVGKSAPAYATPPSEDDEDIVDVTVTPPLPTAKGAPAEEVLEAPPLQTEEPVAAPLGQLSRSGGSRQSVYVALRQVPSANSKSVPPLKQAADTAGIYGVRVLGSPGSAGGQFFRVGERYSYEHGGGIEEFICLGVFNSAGEARAIHPSLANEGTWNQLSPQETLSLGSGAWKQGGKMNLREGIASTPSKRSRVVQD